MLEIGYGLLCRTKKGNCAGFKSGNEKEVKTYLFFDRRNERQCQAHPEN